MHRLFFAAVPDAAARVAIARTVDGLRRVHAGDGWVAADKWHVTLAFLGSAEAFPDALAARAVAAAERLAAQGTQSRPVIRLDRLHDFDGGRRPWVLGASAPSGVDALAAALRAALAAAGVACDARPFVPHLTVRRAREPAPAGEITPIEWPVADFVLFHSGPAAPAYREVARFASA